MALFTSKASGNWSSGGQTTWNEVGVPGAGDTVSIGAHNITVDVNTTIGTSPNDTTTRAITYTQARTLTIAAGVTLTCRGSIGFINGCGLLLQAGANLVFDASLSGGTPVYLVANGGFTTYTLNGTEGARCSISAVVGHTCNLGNGGWAGFAAAFSDFTRVSNLQMPSNTGDIVLTDVVFTSCAVFNPTINSTVLSLVMRRVRFVSGTNATQDINIGMQQARVSGTREIIGCVLQKQFTNLSKSFTVVGNYFGAGVESITGVADFAMFRYNFVKQDGNLGNGNGAIFGSSCHRNYFVVENLTGNPHYIAPQALLGADNYVEQNVFEAQTPDIVDTGDCVLLFQTCCSGGRKIVARNNIVLKSGSANVSSGSLCTLYNAPATTLSEWFRNTVNANDSATGRRGMFSIGEAGTGFAGQIAQLKSNVVWGSTAGQGWIGERILGNVKDIITPAGADRNWRHNLTAGDNQRGYEDRPGTNTLWTAGDAVAAGVDANGVDDDPEFVDPDRNLAAWNAARGYGAATYAAALVSLQADPSRAADLVAYIFEGYRVRNAAARNAAHDGGVVGAANYVKPGRYFGTIENLGAYLQNKYDIEGSSVESNVTVSLSVSVGMTRGISVSVGIR